MNNNQEQVCENCGKHKERHQCIVGEFSGESYFYCSPYISGEFKPKTTPAFKMEQLPNRPKAFEAYTGGGIRKTVVLKSELEDQLKSVLDREAATTARYDEKIEELEDNLRAHKRAIQLLVKAVYPNAWYYRSEGLVMAGTRPDKDLGQSWKEVAENIAARKELEK